MSEYAPEINPDQQTPWVMCPECGGTWFQLAATLERGRWSEDGERYELAETPRVGAWVSADGQGALECRDCKHRFDLVSDEGEA